jgi:hypothetical protein
MLYQNLRVWKQSRQAAKTKTIGEVGLTVMKAPTTEVGETGGDLRPQSVVVLTEDIIAAAVEVEVEIGAEAEAVVAEGEEITDQDHVVQDPLLTKVR